MPRTTLFSGLAIVLALSVAALAGQLAVSEWRAIRFLALSEEGRLRHLVANSVALPPSIRTGRDTLLACENVLLGQFYVFQPAKVQADITQHCADLAATATMRSPNWSLAHYLTALTSHLQGDLSARDASLARAQDLAPHEAWLATRRFDLAQKDRQSKALRTIADADIAVLLDSEAGRAQLVSAYLTDDALRTHVATVEAGREADQR